MPGGVFLAWLACWLLSWKFIFLFRAACLYAGCLGFYASFPPGEGSWFLRLAWRYGCCFWRRPFPYPWCSPDAGGTVSVSTFLGWFAILEVLVLKSRVSPFLLVSYASRVVPWVLGSLSSGPPSEGGSLVLQFVVWGSRAPPDIWPRASVSLLAFDLLVAWSLRLWGDPCLGDSVALLPGASALSFASSCWRCSSGPPLLLGWRASLSRPGQRETNRMGERF